MALCLTLPNMQKNTAHHHVGKKWKSWRNIRHLIFIIVLINILCTLYALLYTQSPDLKINSKFIIEVSEHIRRIQTCWISFLALKYQQVYLFHEEKDFVSPTFYVVLNLLLFHLHKIPECLRAFDDAETAHPQEQRSKRLRIE